MRQTESYQLEDKRYKS